MKVPLKALQETERLLPLSELTGVPTYCGSEIRKYETIGLRMKSFTRIRAYLQDFSAKFFYFSKVLN